MGLLENQRIDDVYVCYTKPQNRMQLEPGGLIGWLSKYDLLTYFLKTVVFCVTTLLNMCAYVYCVCG